MRRDPLLPPSVIAVPVVANLLAVAIWLPLLRVEPGGAIRPMRESCFAFLIALIAFALGVPGGAALIKQGRRLLGIVCLAGSVTPLFTGLLTANLITYMNDLFWEP
jgi:hypothetical protein